MTRWLISAPAWGERCVDVLCAAALPALERAVLRLQEHCTVDGHVLCDAQIVVHTDQPARVRHAASQVKVEPRPVPAGARDFDCLSQAHREVLQMACSGDVVVLLTADMVVSGEALVHCERVLSSPQKKLVCCAAPRALQEGRIPDTTDARALMDWAWTNRHPMTRECTWPEGKSVDLSRLYFEDGGAVVAHWCLPHPLAVRIDGRALRFTPTVDANLIQCFDETEVHMVADSGELAVVELSPRDKGFQCADETVGHRVSAGAVRVTDPMQRWFLRHRVVLLGPLRGGESSAAVDLMLSEGKQREGEGT